MSLFGAVGLSRKIVSDSGQRRSLGAVLSEVGMDGIEQALGIDLSGMSRPIHAAGNGAMAGAAA